VEETNEAKRRVKHFPNAAKYGHFADGAMADRNEVLILGNHHSIIGEGETPNVSVISFQ
jgi:hypothetical protein